MANTYVSISTTTPISDIKNALQSKYGNDFIMHYETTAYLIFSCIAISDKVIKIYTRDNYFLSFYYGDAWSSGSAITNEVQFGGSYWITGSSERMTACHLVLGDSFFLFIYLATFTFSSLTIIGKLTNNNYIAVGFLGATSRNTYCIGKNTTNGKDIVMTSQFLNSFSTNSSKLFKQLLIFSEKSSGFIEENIDGSFATIPELFNISYKTSNASVVVTPNAFFSPCVLYMSDGKTWIQTCLFAEF